MPQSREEYESHLNLLKKSDLRFVILWQDRDSIIPIKMLEYYTNLGAVGFIIANNDNAAIIKKYNPGLLVIASIVQRLCKKITETDFSFYDYIVMYYPFNRALNTFKFLSKIKDKLVIMPNSFCHTDCPGVHHWFMKDKKTFNLED